MINKKYSENDDKKYSSIIIPVFKDFVKNKMPQADILENDEGEKNCDYFDFTLVDGDEEILVEIEAASSERWEGGKIKYSDISVPYRKNKNKASVYIMISTDGKSLWSASMRAIHSCNTIKKWCRNSRREEDFYRCPHSIGIYYKKTKDGWTKIK